jgi:hypothetical protein
MDSIKIIIQPFLQIHHIMLILQQVHVRKFIHPAVSHNFVRDRYAFKPSGPTPCALVTLFHYVTLVLETNGYVRCLVIYFSKTYL